MSARSILPNELLLHILLLSDYKDVLKVRMVNRFCKELIDSSSSIRLLIELGRDGLYPVYSSALDNTAAKSLDRHLRKRERWNQFVLSNPRLIPPQDHEFHIYEFAGGMLAHCIPGSTTDSISIRSLADVGEEAKQADNLYDYSSRMNGGYHVSLPFKCAEFSFDRTQDLLVAIEDLSPDLPVHIFSLSTGRHHSKATKPVFNKFFDNGTAGANIDITIDEGTVSLAYKLDELLSDLHTAVFDWKTGEILLVKVMQGASTASLLSPRYLMAICCGHECLVPSLDIYDLALVHGDPSMFPVLRLSLPELSANRSRPNRFASSYFIHSTQNSSYADSWSGVVRNGETDVVCIQIRLSRESIAEQPFRLYLFLSKKRLLELASAGFGDILDQNMDRGINREDYVHIGALSEWHLHERDQVREIPYADWSASGKYTRWIDGSSIHGMTRCAMLGSRFVCLGSPVALGLVHSLHRELVCLLEFNERLFSNTEEQDEESVVRSFNQPTRLMRGIDADVRGGLPYKITCGEISSTIECFDLLVGSDHVVVRLTEGFEVYNI